MIKDPQQLAKKLGLVFKHPENFSLAMTHRSMSSNNNERLEFLGDAILGFVIAQQLYASFPNASEGVLSRLRASLVNQESLASLAREHNFGDYLILGSGELKSGGYRRDSILSDAVEAIIGALYNDQGIHACESWILQLFANKLATLNLNSEQKDPKTRLQELMQSNGVELPKYELVNMSGLAHAKKFKIDCMILNDKKCTGEGSSRKKAEQSAAEKMLLLLQRESQ